MSSPAPVDPVSHFWDIVRKRHPASQSEPADDANRLREAAASLGKSLPALKPGETTLPALLTAIEQVRLELLRFVQDRIAANEKDAAAAEFDALRGWIFFYGQVSRYTHQHSDAAARPSPEQVWALSQFLGVGAREYQQLTGQAVTDWDELVQLGGASVQKQLRRVRWVGQIKDTLEDVPAQVYKAGMITVIRDAALVRAYRPTIPDWPELRDYLSVFVQVVQQRRENNARQGASSAGPALDQKRCEDEVKRLDSLQSLLASPDAVASDDLELVREGVALREHTALSWREIALILGRSYASPEFRGFTQECERIISSAKPKKR